MMKKNELSHKLVGYSLLKYHENGKVEIELSPNLAPHLLGLKNNYTQHLLLDTTKLKK